CLLVAHHDAFRNNANELMGFIEAVNRLNCRLNWRRLEDTLQRSFRWRRNINGSKSLQMFSHTVLIKNDSPVPHSVLVVKRECDPDAVKALRQGNVAIDWRHDRGYLHCQVEIPSQSAVHLSVEYWEVLRDYSPTDHPSFNVKTRLRRWLSEIRDNH